jgi:hypothetical protein
MILSILDEAGTVLGSADLADVVWMPFHEQDDRWANRTSIRVALETAGKPCQGRLSDPRYASTPDFPLVGNFSRLYPGDTVTFISGALTLSGGFEPPVGFV